MTTDPTPDPAAVAARHKHILREMLVGYAVANEVIDQERIERLRKMTPEQSWADYVALWQWHQMLKREDDIEGLRRLEDWRL